MTRTPLLLAALLLGAAASARAGPPPGVAAVLSSDAPHFHEGLEGLEEVLGGTVSVVVLGAAGFDLPRGTKVAVLFGAKAGAAPLPEGTHSVLLMAPGFETRGREPSTRVSTLPAPDRLLEGLLELQPALKRLGALYSSRPSGEYVRALARTGASRGVEVLPLRLDSAEDLPPALRSLRGRADAFWVAPDPGLFDRSSFAVLKDFAWSSRLTFFAPLAGLVEKGASAAVAVSFKEMGRRAGEEALLLLRGHEPAGRVYHAEAHPSVHPSRAVRFGLDLPKDAGTDPAQEAP